MVFIETPIFSQQLRALLSEEEFAAFQAYLMANPKAGDVIQGTGGLRKVRWSVECKGKSGGVRVIYFHVTAADQIRLLLIYRKGRQDDLTPDQKKTLRELNKHWKE
jgi:hypothetical protein